MDRIPDPVLRDDPKVVTDDVDFARAREYALLATLLWRGPDAGLIARLALLRGDASPLGRTHSALAEAAAKASVESVRAEYFQIFEGVGRSQILPYASFYLTGSLHGRPLVRLRETLQGLGIERTECHSEPEDHAAFLCEVMADLAGGQIAAPADAERAIFETHLAPWIRRFFTDLEHIDCAAFYRRVGAVGRTFMGIESEAFRFASI